MKMFTISEFAKLRNININSLRYYEKIGVLKPFRIDEHTGYRYYSPDQLPILDVILLCLDFGMPLKDLKTYIDGEQFIHNNALFAAGKKIAEARVQNALTELNKIEYTLKYIDVNRQYSQQEGIYERKIPERRIAAIEYTGAPLDIKKIEMTSARLYEEAQSKQLAPVFPAGMIMENIDGQTVTKIFFEIMANENSDVSIEHIAAGTFLCRQVSLLTDKKLSDTIEAVYGTCENSKVIVSNMLLDKYQLGTKKSELQKRIIK